MRNLLVGLAVVGLVTATAVAEDPKPAQNKDEIAKTEKPPITLRGGDPAPPLAASNWLRGDEVKRFEPGKVYVVEFWATWCGPCIAFMPHLAELQARYKNQGVTVIGFTCSDDRGNTEESVAAFIKKRGPKLDYTFAFADDRTTWHAWMTAAGRSGIPCNFVVDKSGRIAYVGHPMYLDMAIPMVVAGKLSAQAVSDAVTKAETELNDLSKYDRFTSDPKAGLEALKAWEAKYPPLTDFFLSMKVKLHWLPKYGRAGEAKQYAATMVTKAIQRRDRDTLSSVSALLRRGDGRDFPELVAIAVKAAEADVLLSGGTDVDALIDLADAYSVAGDRAKAKEYARKAVEAATDEPDARKQSIEKEARTLGYEK